MQQFLKAAARAARAWIVTAELLFELFMAVDNLAASLDFGLGGEASAALAGSLKSGRARRSLLACAWSTSTSPNPSQSSEAEWLMSRGDLVAAWRWPSNRSAAQPPRLIPSYHSFLQPRQAFTGRGPLRVRRASKVSSTSF